MIFRNKHLKVTGFYLSKFFGENEDMNIDHTSLRAFSNALDPECINYLSPEFIEDV